MPPATPTSSSGGRGRGGGSGRGSRGGARSGSARATAQAASSGGAMGSHRGGGSGGGGGANARRTNVGIGQGRRGPFVYRGEFRRDVQGLMYAFGDSPVPDPTSVALMEDMVVSFLVDLIRRARPTPALVNMPTNNVQITAVAQAYAQQQTYDREQARLDEAVIRAATDAGSSALAKAQQERRAADSLAAQERERRNADMTARPFAHPHVARTRLTVDDIKFACRKDAKLTSRIEELIYLDKEITSARRVFDVPAEEAIQDNSIGVATANPTSAANGAQQ